MNFKQLTAAAVVAMMVSASAASAKTYVLTLTTQALKRCKDSGPGISGVTKLTVSFYSSTPFPASYDGAYPAMYSFSDGVDTLASLTNAGFTVQYGYPFLYYGTDGSGKKITSWYIRTNMPNDTDNNYYSWSFSSNFEGESGGGIVFQTLPAGKTTAQDCGLPASAKFSTAP